MSKSLYKVVTLGAVWGIFEATVGYLLHLSGLRIGGMIWFPVAYFFVYGAYRASGSYRAALLTAMIASSIKLVNLCFPGRVDMVVNPAVSILLEALAVVLVCQYAAGGEAKRVNPLAVALTGFLWRGLYIFYIFSMPPAYFDRSAFTATESFLEFFFVKNTINIAIISVGLFAADGLRAKWEPAWGRLRRAAAERAAARPSVAAGSVALAVAVQVLIG